MSVFAQGVPIDMGRGASRKDLPGGVRDIKRICERVAWRGRKRMRALLDMGKGGLEVL